MVVNEPARRGRFVGADLLPFFAEQLPLDVLGMGVRQLPERLGAQPARRFEDLPQRQMHAELAQRRLYLHPVRWTSLGLSLIEAMLLGMPVVALAATGAVEAIPPGAGVLSTRKDVLRGAAARLLADSLLAQRIRELLTAPVRRGAYGAAADRATSRYSWERISHETLTAYEHLAQRAAA